MRSVSAVPVNLYAISSFSGFWNFCPVLTIYNPPVRCDEESSSYIGLSDMRALHKSCICTVVRCGRRFNSDAQGPRVSLAEGRATVGPFCYIVCVPTYRSAGHRAVSAEPAARVIPVRTAFGTAAVRSDNVACSPRRRRNQYERQNCRDAKQKFSHGITDFTWLR